MQTGCYRDHGGLECKHREIQDGDTDNNRLDQRSDYEREPPPLRSEVEWVLGNIGNRKAPVVDDIPIELWKPQEKEFICSSSTAAQCIDHRPNRTSSPGSSAIDQSMAPTD